MSRIETFVDAAFRLRFHYAGHQHRSNPDRIQRSCSSSRGTSQPFS
jgi:hypothetical protein